MNILELYLNSKLIRGKSSSTDFTQVPSYNQMTHPSESVGPSSFNGNTRNQMLTQKIIDMEAQLAMTFTSYCYE